MPTKLITILGPTASGKSAVALILAQRLTAEIISCDSMQIYRGLDIGTAKPSAEEQKSCPHHLVDFLDPAEPYSSRKFEEDADRIIRDCLFRGIQPILCGGTGMYARALLYGFEMWPSDRDIAAELRRDFEAGSGESLFTELAAAAPEVAEQRRDNPRHWLRALEVLRITGRPPPTQKTFTPPDYAAPEFILSPSPELTRARVRKRTGEMLAAGWIRETEELVAAGLLDTPTACQALGYQDIAAFLRGEIASKSELLERLITLTCRYAKRQRTWFRNQHPSGIAIPVRAEDTAESIANVIQAQL